MRRWKATGFFHAQTSVDNCRRVPSRRPVSPANERASERTNERASEQSSPLLSNNNNGQVTQLRNVRTKLSATSTVCIAVLIRRDTRALVRPRQFRATRATKVRLSSLVRTDQSRRSPILFPSLPIAFSLSLSFSLFFLFLSTSAEWRCTCETAYVRSCDRYGRKSSAGERTRGWESTVEISSETDETKAEETTTLSLSLSRSGERSKGTSEQGKRRREEVQGPWVLALSKTASD